MTWPPHPDLTKARQRFTELMRRFVLAEDLLLTDREAGRAVWQRFCNDWDIPLIDPNE